MKNPIINSIIVFIVVFSSLLIGCSDSSDSSFEKSILGTWSGRVKEGPMLTLSVEFKDDGTLNLIQNGDSFNGKYTLKEDGLVQITIMADSEDAEIEFEGDEMHFRWTGSPQVYILKK
jgi:hypothetical protein